MQLAIYNTVELPNNRHIGGRDLVLYREVARTRRLTSKPHPRLNLLSLRSAALREVKSVNYADTFRVKIQDGANGLNETLSKCDGKQ